MDARTKLERRPPTRHATEGSSRAPQHSCTAFVAASGINAALQLPTIAEIFKKTGIFKKTKIFKKTLCVADLKPAGRYVAKDMREIGAIPLLKTTLFDNGLLYGDCMTVTGRMIAENLKSMKPRLDVVHSTVDAGTLNVKLTDAERAGRETKSKPRETNETPGALWKFAQHVGPAVDGAIPHPGGAHEKQCYADI